MLDKMTNYKDRKEQQYWIDILKSVEEKKLKSKKETLQSNISLFKKYNINFSKIRTSRPEPIKPVLPPNITASEQDVAILELFNKLMQKICKELNLYYYDNNMINNDEKPNCLYCELHYKENKSQYKGHIKVVNNKGSSLKKLSIEKIITDNNFIIDFSGKDPTNDFLKVSPDVFPVLYNIDDNSELKDIILESLLQNDGIIKYIQIRKSI